MQISVLSGPTNVRYHWKEDGKKTNTSGCFVSLGFINKRVASLFKP